MSKAVKTTRKSFVTGILVLATALAGCAAFASHDEYGRYRTVRTASEERDRLIAMQEYVEHHPQGSWIAEVQAMRAESEDQIWISSSSTREGLEWYLQIYPDGRYVDQARPRLAALDHVANTAAEQAQAELALRAQQREAAAAARRTWVTRAVQYWTRTMVGLNGYGRSLRNVARGNADFAQAFGAPPAPVCVQNEYCIKHYGQLYHIPVPGSTRIDNHIDVYLRITMDEGRVERAEILLPDHGFSRWFEMENGEVINDADETARFRAINWALERIQPIIEEVATGAQQIDVIPDPPEPLQVHQEAADTDEAPLAPGDEAPAEATPAPAAEGGEGEGGSDFSDLLDQAAGGEEQETPDPAQQVEAEEIVLPIGLIAYSYRGLQITVLGAGADDYGQAFDGVVIERTTD